MVAWKNGKNVVVLGAGATRAASFVNPSGDRACLPPLNADFFTQLQRVAAPNRQEDVDAVLKDVVESFGANFNLSLEEYFTHIEALLRGGELFLAPGNTKYSATKLRERRAHLLDALSAVLEESVDVTRKSSPAVKSPCTHHRALVEALGPADTIISFNYDCLIDHALRTSARARWSARYGYGLPKPSRLDDSGVEVWSGGPTSIKQNDTIRLLKLHGSLNWREWPSDPDALIRLREKIYKQNGQKAYEIIPPEFLKAVEREPFQTLWKRAASALKSAETIAMVGFSFPPTDQLVEAMFRMALEENRKLKRLVIVNPSKIDRDRMRKVCTAVLSRPTTRVVQFDYFSEFSPHAARLLSQR